MTLPKMTILAVDDETMNTELIRRSFRNYETVTLHTASSGSEGLAFLRTVGCVDVMLVDQSMPHMTGVAFLEAAATICPSTVNIMVTGYPELTEVLEAQEQGLVTHIVPKPWKTEDLQASVTRAMTFSEMNQAVSSLQDTIDK